MNAREASDMAGRLAVGLEYVGLKCELPIRDGARIVGWKAMSPVVIIGQTMRVTGCRWSIAAPSGEPVVADLEQARKPQPGNCSSPGRTGTL